MCGNDSKKTNLTGYDALCEFHQPIKPTYQMQNITYSQTPENTYQRKG